MILWAFEIWLGNVSALCRLVRGKERKMIATLDTLLGRLQERAEPGNVRKQEEDQEERQRHAPCDQ